MPPTGRGPRPRAAIKRLIPQESQPEWDDVAMHRRAVEPQLPHPPPEPQLPHPPP